MTTPLSKSMSGTNEMQRVALGYMLKYVIKALHADVLEAAQVSTKDGIAAFTHAGQVLQLVFQAELLQSEDGAHELTHSLGAESAVELTGAVAHSEHHSVAVSTKLAIGCSVDGGEYFLIVGAWVCPFSELCIHSSLSGDEVELMRGVASR